MMELTFIDLCQDHATFEPVKSLIGPSGRPITRIKLSQQQLDLLNEKYAFNVEKQVQTFCTEKGVSYQFLLQLNRCVMNSNEFAELTASYKEQQLKRLVPLGIDVSKR